MRIFVAVFLAFLLFFCSESDSFSKENLQQSIVLSGNYIVNFTNKDGKFDYLVNPEDGKVNQRNYNILRHSGAIYSLGQYYQYKNDKKVLDNMVLTTNYLKECCIFPIDAHIDKLAVWSLPKINRSVGHKKAKLGGTGLGLVALVSLENIKPGTTDLDYLRKMGDFILYMQKDDGSFYSRYIPSTGGRDDSWTSLYYPGEAALGLAMLYEIDPQPKWFNASVKVLTYLAESRKNEKTVPMDHWALIATNKVFKIADEKSLSIPRKALIDHGIKITELILKNVPQFPETSPVYGCLLPDGRTTPNSTRLEGLLAFYSVLPDGNEELKERIEAVSSGGIGFLQRAQIKEGSYKGGVPKAVKRKKSKDAGLIRIDYVQHALSAMIEYQNLFGN